MSILGGGSNAGSLFIPNGLSLHIDAETLNAGEEEERRKDEEKQAEQLRQLICEELSELGGGREGGRKRREGVKLCLPLTMTLVRF